MGRKISKTSSSSQRHGILVTLLTTFWAIDWILWKYCFKWVREGLHLMPSVQQTLNFQTVLTQLLPLLSIDLLFPLCGQSVAQNHIWWNPCTHQIKSAYLKWAAEQELKGSTSYSQDEKFHFSTTVVVVWFRWTFQISTDINLTKINPVRATLMMHLFSVWWQK